MKILPPSLRQKGGQRWTTFKPPAAGLSRRCRGRLSHRRSQNASVAQVSLAWLLHKPGVTSVIVGARKEEQLIDNLGAADIALSDEEVAQLDAVSALKPEYPHYIPPQQRGETLFSRFQND